MADVRGKACAAAVGSAPPQGSHRAFGRSRGDAALGTRKGCALAETINGPYKAEVIHPSGPWRSIDEVEFATLEWVDWFNNRRLLGPIGYMPPTEFEAMYDQQQGATTMEVALN